MVAASSATSRSTHGLTAQPAAADWKPHARVAPANIHQPTILSCTCEARPQRLAKPAVHPLPPCSTAGAPAPTARHTPLTCCCTPLQMLHQLPHCQLLVAAPLARLVHHASRQVNPGQTAHMRLQQGAHQACPTPQVYAAAPLGAASAALAAATAGGGGGCGGSVQRCAGQQQVPGDNSHTGQQ